MYLVVKESSMKTSNAIEAEARTFAAITHTAREIVPSLGALAFFKFKGDNRAAEYLSLFPNVGYSYRYDAIGHNLSSTKVYCKVDWSSRVIFVLRDDDGRLIAQFTEEEAEEHLVHIGQGYRLFKLWKKIRHHL